MRRDGESDAKKTMETLFTVWKYWKGCGYTEYINNPIQLETIVEAAVSYFSLASSIVPLRIRGRARFKTIARLESERAHHFAWHTVYI